MNEERSGWDTIVNVGDMERLASLAGGGWLGSPASSAAAWSAS